MMNLEIILKYYLLIFVRVSAVMILFPGFGSSVFPREAKVLIILIVSLVIAIGFPPIFVPAFSDNLIYTGYIIKEIVLGMVIGFVSQMPFLAATAGGDIISFASNFSMAQVVDPSQGTRNTIFGEFYDLLAVLIFFIINGHLIVIQALHYSFTVIPVNSALHLGPEIWKVLVSTGTIVLLAGTAIAAPVVVVLFISNVAMGIISKTMPTFNVFMVGMPLQMVLAFVVILLTIGVDSNIIRNLFDRMFHDINYIIKAAGA